MGLVWTPDAVENLSLSIDFYNVQVDDAINNPDPVDVILTCYITPNLAAPECARISRGPSGTITRFDLLNESLARLETSGIDLSAGYILSTDFGDVSIAGNVNWLNEYVEKTGGGSWRYLDAMDVFDTIEFDNIHATVDAVNYFDLYGNYRGDIINVTIGAENLTDKTPPYVPDVALNTSSIYDYSGFSYITPRKSCHEYASSGSAASASPTLKSGN